MCKYKDTNLGIKKLDFGMKRGAMAVYLTDGRVVIVPVSMFPDIKRLSRSQREDYMIMDDQYFSFEALSKIYSVKDVLKYWTHPFETSLSGDELPGPVLLRLLPHGHHDLHEIQQPGHRLQQENPNCQETGR